MSADETHSNDYAAGTGSDKTFAERKAVEQRRGTIGAYRFSKLGSNFATRGEYVRPEARHYKKPERKVTRQEANANGGSMPERAASQNSASRQETNARPQGFKEPPARGYNPYA